MKKLIAMNVMVVAALVLSLGQVHAGSVKGTIKYDGKVPKLKPINMAADPACQAANKGKVMPDILVLGAGNTLGNVFLQVTGNLPAKTHATPTEPVVINQKGCRYDPHVVGVMAGQPIRILNSDPTLHNVHAMPKVNRGFNMAMPQTVKEKTKKFRKPEPFFPIKCDVHPWMKVWVSVLDHPYFSVSKKNGQFEIKDLPAGSYEVTAWHAKLGKQAQKVTVPATGAATLNFTFSKPTTAKK